MKEDLYYQLSAIKSYFLAHTYHSERLKDYVKNTYFTNLFSMYNFEEVYDDQKQIIVNNNDFKTISEPIIPLIKSYKDDANLYSINLSKNANTMEEFHKTDRYILSKYTKNFSINNDKKGQRRILNKAKRYKCHHLENLKQLRTANMILSIDFEYNGLSKDNVSEVGLAIYKPQEDTITYKYFIVDDFKYRRGKKHNLQNNFNFGKVNIKSKKEIFEEVSEYVKEADVLLAHDIINELQILNIKPNWNSHIDTKFCELVLNPKTYYYSLKDALLEYNIPHSFLHNAGNDAAYALHLALAMLNEVENKKCKLLY